MCHRDYSAARNSRTYWNHVCRVVGGGGHDGGHDGPVSVPVPVPDFIMEGPVRIYKSLSSVIIYNLRCQTIRIRIGI